MYCGFSTYGGTVRIPKAFPSHQCNRDAIPKHRENALRPGKNVVISTPKCQHVREITSQKWAWLLNRDGRKETAGPSATLHQEFLWRLLARRLVNDEPWKRAYIVFETGADTLFVT